MTDYKTEKIKLSKHLSRIGNGDVKLYDIEWKKIYFAENLLTTDFPKKEHSVYFLDAYSMENLAEDLWDTFHPDLQDDTSDDFKVEDIDLESEEGEDVSTHTLISENVEKHATRFDPNAVKPSPYLQGKGMPLEDGIAATAKKMGHINWNFIRRFEKEHGKLPKAVDELVSSTNEFLQEILEDPNRISNLNKIFTELKNLNGAVTETLEEFVDALRVFHAYDTTNEIEIEPERFLDLYKDLLFLDSLLEMPDLPAGPEDEDFVENLSMYFQTYLEDVDQAIKNAVEKSANKSQDEMFTSESFSEFVERTRMVLYDEEDSDYEEYLKQDLKRFSKSKSLSQEDIEELREAHEGDARSFYEGIFYEEERSTKASVAGIRNVEKHINNLNKKVSSLDDVDNKDDQNQNQRKTNGAKSSGDYGTPISELRASSPESDFGKASTKAITEVSARETKKSNFSKVSKAKPYLNRVPTSDFPNDPDPIAVITPNIIETSVVLPHGQIIDLLNDLMAQGFLDIKMPKFSSKQRDSINYELKVSNFREDEAGNFVVSFKGDSTLSISDEAPKNLDETDDEDLEKLWQSDPDVSDVFNKK